MNYYEIAKRLSKWNGLKFTFTSTVIDYLDISIFEYVNFKEYITNKYNLYNEKILKQYIKEINNYIGGKLND